ncbi:MAG: glycosyltransferase family 2 protein [bacterium]|nr:glycosyltransferase family 2 protein [bacterium]
MAVTSAIVPTLGLSRWLVDCLRALRRSGGEDLEILLVAQGGELDAKAESLADRILRTPANLGFAAATNLGLSQASGDLLATVNDDAVVDRDWYARLCGALDAQPRAAAVQGVQLKLDDPSKVDGAGVAWNRFWQAVQIGRDGSPDDLPATDVEIFGVSATAAIYRRSALAEATDAGLQAFDERLFAYYEDVDLACRLRAAGYRALLVPGARAAHAGSVSGRRLPGGTRRLIYRNRHRVLARLLGRAYWPRLPWLVMRDKLDLFQALIRGDARTAAGIASGGLTALGSWPRFAHFGKPLVPLAELRRFRTDADNPGFQSV